MEEYIVYLFYLSVVLILGILITAVTEKLKISAILFLVLLGFWLNSMGFNYFHGVIVFVLSELALIMMILESTMDVDLKTILHNFMPVLRFCVANFIVSCYIMTLALFLILDLPGKDFNTFILCLLFSIVVYGVDPGIVTEFFKERRTRVRNSLDVEGMISTPFVAVFAFFVIGYMARSQASFTFGILSQFAGVGKMILFAAILGVGIAYLLFRFLQKFRMRKDLVALLIISIAIAVYALGDSTGLDGSVAVAFYGLLLAGLHKDELAREYSSLMAHLLYIIVFVLLGTELILPEKSFMPKAVGLFVLYLILRFALIWLMYKEFSIGEKIFMALNTSKGIETAVVLYVMKLNFSSVAGIGTVLALGFFFFILSYIVSTIASHFSRLFLAANFRDFRNV